MKADSTIKRELKKLRHIVENNPDHYEARFAQAMETAIKWAREDTHGWPSPSKEAIEMPKCLKIDLAVDRARHPERGHSQ